MRTAHAVRNNPARTILAWALGSVAVVGTAMLVTSFPALRRYIRMRQM